MGKFGWDVAILDINKDGIDDLAVSAPSQGNCLSFLILPRLALIYLTNTDDEERFKLLKDFLINLS